MPNNHSQVALNDQKAKVSGGSPKLKIIAPCTQGNGILKLMPKEEAYYEDEFHKISSPLCFFIPASGSGSRMFDFLQMELASGKPEKANKTNDFIKSLNLISTKTIIGNRQIYTSSMGEGKTAVEKQKKGSAVEEIKNLSEQIILELQ